MAVNPNTVPTLTPFQKAHVGTTQTGLSGVLPFMHKTPPSLPAPLSGTVAHVIGSHFHLFNGGILSTTVKNRAYY